MGTPQVYFLQKVEKERPMSRQLDVKAEERETAKRNELVKALEYGLAGAVEFQGGTLRGLAIRYDDFSCLLTIKADFDGKWMVAHMSSDTMPNSILATFAAARRNKLSWSRDKYQPSQV